MSTFFLDTLCKIDFRACDKNKVKSLEEAEKTYRIQENNWKHIVVVREPVDRFLSGYLFTCLRYLFNIMSLNIGMFRGIQMDGSCRQFCHDCGLNLTCFMESHYRQIMQLSKEKDGPNDFDFGVFHLIPQNWRCSFDQLLSNYTILRYESASEKIIPKIVDYLRTQNVSSKASDYIKKSVLGERTHHSTVTMDIRPFYEKRLRESSYLMHLLNRIYYHDYKLFNYTIPTIV